MATRKAWQQATINGNPYKAPGSRKGVPGRDARVKLTPAQKEQIRALYALGSHSQRDLATLYQVSRRLIVFTIYPDRLAKAHKAFAIRQKEGRYYSTEKRREYMRTYRKRLRAINATLPKTMKRTVTRKHNSDLENNAKVY